MFERETKEAYFDSSARLINLCLFGGHGKELNDVKLLMSIISMLCEKVGIPDPAVEVASERSAKNDQPSTPFTRNQACGGKVSKSKGGGMLDEAKKGMSDEQD